MADSVVRIGWKIVVTLAEGTAPHRCYMGKVSAVDGLKMRIELIDAATGEDTDTELIVPFRSLISALTAAPSMDFADLGKDWYEVMSSESAPISTIEESPPALDTSAQGAQETRG